MAADRESGPNGSSLEAIAERLRAGGRLAAGDAAVLATTSDLVALGALAVIGGDAARGLVTVRRVVRVAAGCGRGGPARLPRSRCAAPPSCVRGLARGRRPAGCGARGCVSHPGFRARRIWSPCVPAAAAAVRARGRAPAAGLPRRAARADAAPTPRWLALAAAGGCRLRGCRVASAASPAWRPPGASRPGGQLRRACGRSRRCRPSQVPGRRRATRSPPGCAHAAGG